MASVDQIKAAITSAEEGLALFRELDYKPGILFGLNLLGELARLDGDYPRAGGLYEECLALSIEMGNKQHEAITFGNLSYIAYHLGNYNQAIDYCQKELVLMGALGLELVAPSY